MAMVSGHLSHVFNAQTLAISKLLAEILRLLASKANGKTQRTSNRNTNAYERRWPSNQWNGRTCCKDFLSFSTSRWHHASQESHKRSVRGRDLAIAFQSVRWEKQIWKEPVGFVECVATVRNQHSRCNRWWFNRSSTYFCHFLKNFSDKSHVSKLFAGQFEFRKSGRSASSISLDAKRTAVETVCLSFRRHSADSKFSRTRVAGSRH